MLRQISLSLLLGLICAISASAQTVDELINKYVEARGGIDKIRAVQSIKMTAVLEQNGQASPVVLQRKRPGCIRMEMMIKNQRLIQAYDGATGWVQSPFSRSTNAEKLSVEQAKSLKAQAEFDGDLVDYQQKGEKVELLGKEDVAGSPAYKIKVVHKDGQISYVFLDAKNFLEVKSTDLLQVEGNEIEIDTYSTDYRSVNGLMLPYLQEAKIKDKPAYNVKIEKIELDVAMEDSLFKMPEK